MLRRYMDEREMGQPERPRVSLPLRATRRVHLGKSGQPGGAFAYHASPIPYSAVSGMVLRNADVCSLHQAHVDLFPATGSSAL